MVTKLKKTKHKLIVSTMLIMSCYFAFYALLGEKGVAQLVSIHKDMKRYSKQLSYLTAHQHKIEQNIKGLNGENLDLDLLDEQVRKTLGYADRDEQIIYK